MPEYELAKRRECQREYRRAKYQDPEERDKIKAYNRKWYRANAEKRKASARSYYFGIQKNDPQYQVKVSQRMRGWHRRRKYGVCDEVYNELVLKQNNRCAICGLEGNLCVDHCHRTNRVRALLCKRCNTILGFADDHSDLLAKAAAYLRSFVIGDRGIKPESTREGS